MPAVVFEYDLSQHGINKKVRLQVPDMIDGQGTDGFPRNAERKRKMFYTKLKKKLH